MKWSGEQYKCRNCGEVYPYSLSRCSCGGVCEKIADASSGSSKAQDLGRSILSDILESEKQREQDEFENELAQLYGAVKEACNKKEYSAAISHLVRILEITPDSKEAKELLDFCKKKCEQERQRLEQQRQEQKRQRLEQQRKEQEQLRLERQRKEQEEKERKQQAQQKKTANPQSMFGNGFPFNNMNMGDMSMNGMNMNMGGMNMNMGGPVSSQSSVNSNSGEYNIVANNSNITLPHNQTGKLSGNNNLIQGDNYGIIIGNNNVLSGSNYGTIQGNGNSVFQDNTGTIIGDNNYVNMLNTGVMKGNNNFARLH